MKLRSLLFVVAAISLLGLLIQSCGVKPCSCPTGCCDQNNVCQSGTSPTACGAANSVCRVCSGGQLCTFGTCNGNGGTGGGSEGAGGGSGGGTALSCAATCAGCCDLVGNCLAGTVGTACGKGGASCAPCSGAQSCDQGECRDTGCSSSCVSSAVCVSPLTNDKCGSNGRTCSDCTTNGGTCNTSNGQCQGGTCGGCRDNVGRCQPGNAKGACGTAGGSCNVCSGTTVCSSGQCIGGGAGGGSGAGGGTGGSGGSGVGGGTGGAGAGSGGGPSGENCDNAITVSLSNGIAALHADTRTMADDTQASCAVSGGRDVVYRFVSAGPGAASVQVLSSTGAPTFSFRTSCPTGSSQIGTCSSTSPSATLSEGIYYLWVDGATTGEDTYFNLIVE